MKSESDLFTIAEKIYHQSSESRYSKAIAALKNLLDQYPTNIEGWSMMSTMQSCIHAYDDAIESIEKAIKLDPENLSFWSQKNTLLHKIDKFELKESKYHDLETSVGYEIKRFKNKTELRQEMLLGCNAQIMNAPADYYNLGNLLEEKGRVLESLEEWEAAIDAFQSAVVFHEKHSDKEFLNPIARCYFDIAKIYELQNKLTLAIDYFDKSLAEENEEIILTHKARALLKMGDKTASDKVLSDFVDVVYDKFNTTKDAAYMFQIIDVFKEQNQFDKALQALEKMASKARKYNGLQERISEARTELLQLKHSTATDRALPKTGRTWVQKLFGSE